MIIADIPKKSMPQGHSNFNDSLFDKRLFPNLSKKKKLSYQNVNVIQLSIDWSNFSNQVLPYIAYQCALKEMKLEKAKKRIFFSEFDEN